MVHEMRLHPRPFGKIKAGVKTIEMRLNDEKRRGIKVGERLVFVSREGGERIEAEVTARLECVSFDDLVARHDWARMGYDTRPAAGEHRMNEHYSAEEEARWGVVGLVFKVLHE